MSMTVAAGQLERCWIDASIATQVTKRPQQDANCPRDDYEGCQELGFHRVQNFGTTFTEHSTSGSRPVLTHEIQYNPGDIDHDLPFVFLFEGFSIQIASR